MRAVHVTGPWKIELVEVPEPDAGRDVLVRVDQVGICGTDAKILAGKIPVDYPRLMGHEMVGEVVAGAGPFATGTRVLVDPGVACGWCPMCQVGRPNICPNGGLLGRDIDGVFTEYVVAPVSRLVAIPDGISERASGVLQVLGTCIHAAKSVRPFPGQVAAVLGLGVSGQLIAQLLRVRGMTVVGVTRSAWKCELAVAAGVHYAVSPAEAGEVLAGVSDGRGPDLVVEAVGTEATLAQAIDLVATGGEVLVFGTITGGGEGLPYYKLYHKELTVRNPRAAAVGDYAAGVALAAGGHLDLEPIVTHVLMLEDVAEAFRLVEDPSSLKVLMKVA